MLAVRLNRKDARTDQIVSHKLHERRIANLRDQLLINPPRLFFCEHLGCNHPAGPVVGKPPHNGAVGHRDDQLGLLTPIARVLQPNLNCRRRRALDDINEHADISNLDCAPPIRSKGHNPALRHNTLGAKGRILICCIRPKAEPVSKTNAAQKQPTSFFFTSTILKSP